MKILDWYILKEFLKPLFACVLLFLGIFVFIDSAEKMKYFISFHRENEDSVPILLSFVLGSAFSYLLDFFPFVVCLAGSISFVVLNRSKQIVAIHAAGISFQRICLIPLVFIFCLGFGLFYLKNAQFPNMNKELLKDDNRIRNKSLNLKNILFQEMITPALQKREWDIVQKKGTSSLFDSHYFRPPAWQILSIGEVDLKAKAISLSVTRFDENGHVCLDANFAKAHLINGIWHATGGEARFYYKTGEIFKNISIKETDSIPIASNKNYDQILTDSLLSIRPSSLTLTELHARKENRLALSELKERWMIPFKLLLLLFMVFVFCQYFKIQVYYLALALTLLVACIDLGLGIATEFFGSFYSLPALLVAFVHIVFLYVLTQVVLRKSRL